MNNLADKSGSAEWRSSRVGAIKPRLKALPSFLSSIGSMTIFEDFETAVGFLESGNTDQLRQLLEESPGLAKARDKSNATLLIRLIDWPGHKPNAAATARVLIESGVEVDARRDEKNGTALAGALCTQEVDVIRALVESGADIHLPLGWMPGTILDLADRICQNLGQQREKKILDLTELFSSATGQKLPSQVPMGRSLPIVYLSDVSNGIQFYSEVLGFRVDWTHETPGSDPYVGISRGGAEFHLSACHCADKRHIGNLWVRLECDQIDDLYGELQENKQRFKEQHRKDSQLKFLSEPANQPWGFRELEIEDPEGNRITFYGPTTAEA